MAKTDKQIIITISREYGSGGKEIGEKLAQRLGINFYDKKLIEEAAKAEGIPKNAFNTIESGNLLPFASGYTPETDDVEHYRQAQVIIALAAKEESFVIVGRCADSELKGMKDSLNIFIYAPLEERIKRVQKYLGADANENQIRREIARVDTIRRRFHNRYSYTKWGMREGYDILIDSNILGIDGTVDLLEKMVKEHFEIEG